MKIENLKDLQKLMELCRKQGVEAFEIGEIKFNLGQKPTTTRKLQSVATDFPEANIKIPQFNPALADVIKTDELTEEQLLFYSAQSEMSEEQKG